MIERDPATTIFTGKPCRRGHISPRRADNRDCLECIRLRHRSWYEANRDADLARKAQWVAENIGKKRAYDAAYYQANREKIRAGSARYYAENRETGKAARREYRKKNIDDLRAYDLARYRENPARVFAAVRNRKARLKGASGRHTAADIKAIAEAQGHRCAYCRVSLRRSRHVDHIEPLCRGGSNDRRNLQLLCPPCNLAKHATDPIEFARRRGMLL